MEIVDFKTDKRPDVNNPEDAARVENYHRQLEVYSHILEEKFGKKVKKCARLCDGCDMRFYCRYR